MRTLRRSTKVKAENRSSSISASRSIVISKPKKLQKALNSLSTFLSRFDQVDHTIFETATNLNSFICDILNSTQKHPSHVDYPEFLNTWAKIQTQLSNNIITLNNAQMSILVEKELNAFMSIINQVDSNPPSSQKLQRESKIMVKGITNVINSAKDNAHKKQFDKLKIQMQNLRNDINYQYEPLFKNSQINKEWKDTINDDCKRSLDKIISFCDIAKDLSLTQFPFVEEVTILLNELANESEILKDNAKSLIPRHSPMKYERRTMEMLDNEEKTPLKSNPSKIKRVPNSARSKSEQSSSKISRIPKPKELSTPDRSTSTKKVRSSLSNSASKTKNMQATDSDTSSSRNENFERKPKVAMSARVSKNPHTKKEPIQPPPTNKTFDETPNSKPKPALSRTQKPVRASSISHTTKSNSKDESNAKNTFADRNKEKGRKKTEIVPLQESPKIRRKNNLKDNLASSQQVTFKKQQLNSEEDSSTISEPVENNEQTNDDLVENAKKDLFSFEQRFLKYVATVGASDLLGRFVNELRVTQNAIENDQKSLPHHVSRLNNLISQIEEQINISKPLFEIEQNLSQALNQMSNLSNSMVTSVASNAELAEASTMLKQYEMVREKLEKVSDNRKKYAENEFSKRLQTDFKKFQEAESTFRNAQENNETMKRLRKENIEMRKEMQTLNKNENKPNLENYRKIIIEMKAVNQRMSEIQIERKENPDDIDEIDAELDALLDQQNGLIEQLNSFQF